MKTDVIDLQKVISQKTVEKNFFFVGILSATDEISSGLWNKEYGSRSGEANPSPEREHLSKNAFTQICKCYLEHFFVI
jgi:hypothetical protein